MNTVDRFEENADIMPEREEVK